MAHLESNKGDGHKRHDCHLTGKIGCSVGSICCPEVKIRKCADRPPNCCPPRETGATPFAEEEEGCFECGDGKDKDCDKKICLFFGDSRLVTYTIKVTKEGRSKICFLIQYTVCNESHEEVKNVTISVTLRSGQVVIGTLDNLQGTQTKIPCKGSVTFTLSGCIETDLVGCDLDKILANIVLKANGHIKLESHTKLPIAHSSCDNRQLWIWDDNGTFGGEDGSHNQLVTFPLGGDSVEYTVYQRITANAETCCRKVKNTAWLVNIEIPECPIDPSDTCVLDKSSSSFFVKCVRPKLKARADKDSSTSWCLCKTAEVDCETDDAITYHLNVHRDGSDSRVRVSFKVRLDCDDCDDRPHLEEQLLTGGRGGGKGDGGHGGGHGGHGGTGHGGNGHGGNGHGGGGHGGGHNDCKECCRPRYLKTFYYRITGFTGEGCTGEQIPLVPLIGGELPSFELGCRDGKFERSLCIDLDNQPLIVSISVIITTYNLTIGTAEVGPPPVIELCSRSISEIETTVGEACLPLEDVPCVAILKDVIKAGNVVLPYPSPIGGGNKCRIVSIALNTQPPPVPANFFDQLFSSAGYTLIGDIDIYYTVTFAGCCECITNQATLENNCEGRCSGQSLSAITRNKIFFDREDDDKDKVAVEVPSKGPTKVEAPSIASSPIPVPAHEQTQNRGARQVTRTIVNPHRRNQGNLATGTPTGTPGCATCPGGIKK